MPYVYKITNDVNGKMYIGQTIRTLKERFDDHISESRKSRAIGRPLYDAIRLYGIEHFHIELIEETDSPDEREIYWIEYYGTFKNGYNATFGGGGKHYLDYDLIIETYKQIGSMRETADRLGISCDSIDTILNVMREKRNSHAEVMVNKFGKMVNMFDMNGVYLRTFPSISDAARYLRENGFTNAKGDDALASHIAAACKGKRKSVAKFRWAYAI